MTKLLMMKGLPASGKSTFAKELVGKEKNWKRVNKDDLREMLDNSTWSKDNERFVLELRDFIIRQSISSGVNVVVDDTNLDPKHEKRFREIAQELNAEFMVSDFTDVPLHICLKRDAKREKSVGQEVILDMFKAYLKPPVELVKEGIPCAIICDLDGTLAKFEGNPYARDFSKDKLCFAVANVLWQYKMGHDNVEIIILSGRNSAYRKVTEEWLINAYVQYDLLLMRKEGDARNDRIVKKEFYDNFIKGKYHVLFAMDDRDSIVSLWRELGITCFQVDYGDF